MIMSKKFLLSSRSAVLERSGMVEYVGLGYDVTFAKNRMS